MKGEYQQLGTELLEEWILLLITGFNIICLPQKSPVLSIKAWNTATFSCASTGDGLMSMAICVVLNEVLSQY